MTDYTKSVPPMTPVHRPPFTVQVPGAEKVAGETIPRRHPRAKNGLINRPAKDVATVFDIVRRGARVYPDRNAVGTRKLVKLHRETKKVQKTVDGEVRQVDKEWHLFELSPYSFITYRQYEQLVLEVASGLRHHGLEPGNKVHFFASTSAAWASVAHACASQSISIVTAYDTLGESGVAHSLLQTDAAAMFVDPHLLKTAANPINKSNVKLVIVNEECNFAEGGELEAFRSANPDLKVVTYQELRQAGKDNMVDPNPAKPTDLFCIMYTSGSTGLPKGVCITHEAIPTGIYTCVDECISENDVILAYLPLAHIFELVLESVVLFIGGIVGYGSTRTLSDTSVKNCAGDMRELRPTILVGVPQVWETVKKGVMTKLESAGAISQALFWSAFNYKSFMTRNKLPFASIFDSIVFAKVRQLTGGRLRLTMNGASGVSDHTKHFLSLVLGPMLIGYGLTETCACGALGCPLEYSSTAIGPIPSSIEVKLVSIPELGYDADAKVPQGEIWMRGLPVMKEYFDNPEETAKAKTEDGWFKSGDIGEFDANGHLKVIDRVKNLVKMAGGEYIALEKVESVYRGSQSLANIMVHADPEHNRPIAVIMANEKVLVEKAKELGVDEHRMHSDPKVNGLVLKDLQTTGRRSGLTPMEIVAGVVITEEEWLPPTGLVSATQKLNRKAIRERYKKEIEACLKSLK